MSSFVDSKTVTNASQALIAADRGNSKATVQWISGEDVHLAFGIAAEANKGITLGSTGILIYEIPSAYLKLGVYAITASSTGVVQTSGV